MCRLQRAQPCGALNVLNKIGMNATMNGIIVFVFLIRIAIMITSIMVVLCVFSPSLQNTCGELMFVVDVSVSNELFLVFGQEDSS